MARNVAAKEGEKAKGREERHGSEAARMFSITFAPLPIGV